jgi:hypothetical protein
MVSSWHRRPSSSACSSPPSAPTGVRAARLSLTHSAARSSARHVPAARSAVFVLRTEPPMFPAGRPVRRFVAPRWSGDAVGALRWSGLAAPRLSLGSTFNGSIDSVSGRATARFELRNYLAGGRRGPRRQPGRRTPELSPLFSSTVEPSAAPADASPPATSDDVDRIHLPPEGGPRPGAGGGPDQSIRLHVTVRTPIGLERVRTAGSIPLFPACS